MASQLLTKLNIQAALETANAERQRRTGVTPARVFRDIDTAANLDIALLFDLQGRLKPIHELPLDVRRAMVSVEVVRRNLPAGDGTVEHVHKVKLIIPCHPWPLRAGEPVGESAVRGPPAPSLRALTSSQIVRR
jgi:phage terminase small subunit